MGQITTHVLDTAGGCPASGVAITAYRITDEGHQEIVSTQTNSDGRVDQPLIAGSDLTKGVYELVFSVGQYFGKQEGDVPFLDNVVIRFGVAHADQHYHVPLLISPWSYSTYRGS